VSGHKIYKQVDLFGNEVVCEVPPPPQPKTKTLFNDYEGFVDKFEIKKTTDDCYTPPDIYKLILKYVASIYDLEDKKIIRPFCPNGDYINVDYGDDSVVVDNPPFSILSKIIEFYNSKNIKFFLFAPHLTLFTSLQRCSCVVAACDIVYDNGAKVKTSFVTNMFDEIKVVTSSALYFSVKDLQGERAKATAKPVYTYPENVWTVSSLSFFVQRGFDLEINERDFEFTRGLDSQKPFKKAIFGSGILLSEAKAREAKAREAKAREAKAREAKAREAKAREAKAREALNGLVWELSEREKKIIESLGEQENN
jgi:hypothetical protein